MYWSLLKVRNSINWIYCNVKCQLKRTKSFQSMSFKLHWINVIELRKTLRNKFSSFDDSVKYKVESYFKNSSRQQKQNFALPSFIDLRQPGLRTELLNKICKLLLLHILKIKRLQIGQSLRRARELIKYLPWE